MNQINFGYHRQHCNINGKGCAGTSAPLTLHLPVIRGNQAEHKDVLLRPLFICRILQITASNKMFLYRVLAAMEDDPTAHVSFSLLYYSGIRFGEFLALTPKDFDFEKNTLDINKSLQRIKKQDVVTPPKTPKSTRNIIIPDFVMNEVKDYMSKLYDLKDTDKVFPFTKSYINNAMARACKKSEVKKIRIHDIRHSHASYLINLGYAPLLISERLGHEKVQTTLSTYSHLYPNKHQEVVDMMQNQHQKDMATSAVTAPAETSEEPKPQGTRFKVVSPKDKTSPKQVHENDLSQCVGFAGRT